MKKSLTIFLLFISTLIFAQVPQGINYQSIIRTSAGAVMSNSAVTVDFKLYDGLSGPLLYHESHATNTNQFGMVNLVIGQGTQVGGSVASFSAIPWAIGIGYEVFVNSNIIGTKQLFMSVPYALHSRAPIVTYSNNILSIGGNTATINSSPTYSAGIGIDISGNIISNTLTPITPTITGSGIAVVTPTTGNNFNVSVPVPVLNYNQSTKELSISQGTATSTQTLIGTGTNTISMTGVGIASVSPTVGSNFTVNVQSPTFTNNGPSTIVGTYPNYTLNSTASPTTTLVQGNNITLNQSGNTYTVSSPSQSLSLSSNVLSITGGNSVTLPATVINGVGTGISTVSTTANNFTVNVQSPTFTNNGPSTIVGTYPNYTLNSTASPTTTLVQGNNITLNQSGNTYTVSSPSQSLSLASNVLSITGGNSVTLPATVINGVGTGISTVSTTANNFTVNVPNPTYSSVSGILSFGGTNTVSITSPLSLSGTTLTSGVASNSVNLSSLPGIWSTVSLTNAAITNTASLAGIGTLNPTYKLDVYGTGSVPATIHGYNSGATSSATGVFGENPNNGIGVYGQSNSGAGIWGKSTSGSGVYGESTNGDAGKFILPSNTTTASAVNAQTNGTGPALFARTYNVSPLALAAKFEGHSWMAGKLQLDSTLTVSGYNNPPNPAPLGEGRLYYDKINNKFKVSENGGAYVNLINSNVAPWQFLAGSIFPNNNPASDKVAIGSNLANALLDVHSTNSSGLTTQPVVSIINNNTSFNGLSLLNVVKNVGGGNDVALFENKTTTGGALTAKITNSVSSGNVIEAINDGMSSAAYLKNNLIGNTTTVLQVVHSGGGQGVNIQTNNASALHATSSGTVVPTAYINNSNGEAMQVYAQSRAIYAQNNANGMAAFETVNNGNGPTIMAYKNLGSTLGNVAQFNNNSTTNGADAVLINNAGSGAAIHAISGPTVTGGSNVALWLEEGHIKTSGANATAITTVTAISGVTVIGNDVSGKLSITTTTSSISANQEMIKVTFNKPYPSGVTPNVIITPSNLYSAGIQPYVSSVSNTGFSVFFNLATPNFSRTYTLNYIVIQ